MNYVVTIKQAPHPDNKPFCDAENINYGETCSNRATIRMIGGKQEDLVFCARHANKRSRYAQPIDAPVLVSHSTVSTLDEARELVIEVVSSFPRSPADAVGALTFEVGTIGPLPDGTIIEVEPQSDASKS